MAEASEGAAKFPWGHLASRYEVRQPRKLLALDGGGIRGIITLEILKTIEDLLREKLKGGPDFRLCDFFDYIAGTSTGAIIAAGLARGMSAQQLIEFYNSAGKEMFYGSFLRRFVYPKVGLGKYQSAPLSKKLREMFGTDTNLLPEHLRCLLLIVTRNAQTDSPWPISSNPMARYNMDVSKPGCNLKIPLWQLVRASTAAPLLYEPEKIELVPGNPKYTYLFVDGGVTPYNNPAFLLYRMATLPPYRLNWQTGEENMLLVSVGTGSGAKENAEIEQQVGFTRIKLTGLAHAYAYGVLVDQDTNCRTVGRCVYGNDLDREIGNLIPCEQSGTPIPLTHNTGKAFLYVRYDPDLHRKTLKTLGFTEQEIEKIRTADSFDSLVHLTQIGKIAATEVDLAHFGPFVRESGHT